MKGSCTNIYKKARRIILRKEREIVNKKMPKPVNLNDCVLLHQMGYRVEINDGKYITIAKEGRKRGKARKNIA